jgi:GT2 family glycosyltransferase
VSADLTVVICSLNGATGVDRCLRALSDQVSSARVQVVVVDDGSSDDTSATARRHGALVVRHPVNRGIAAARNSGIAAASAPVVAFLDDDCEPAADWADRLLAAYESGVAGVGGQIEPSTSRPALQGFLERHNPLEPLELSLAGSQRVLFRLGLYLRRQWQGSPPLGHRDVYSLVGANMSFRRDVLLSCGGFDERFRFGAEEVDLCLRLRRPRSARLVYAPDARVTHHFKPSLRDVLRRSRAYGRGSARLFRKWPGLPPTVFPGPLVMAILLAAGAMYVPLLGAAAVLPLALYPQGLRSALAGRDLRSLTDGYVQLGQEAWQNIGFAQGLWTFRRLVPEPGALRGAAAADQHDGGQPACTP